MSAPKHPCARRFSNNGLFSGLSCFAELEARVAGLGENKARGDAFEVFAEAYLATQKITQAEDVWPGHTLPLALASALSLPLTDMGVDGVYRTVDGAHHAYQVKFRSQRPALTWTELSTFMGLADRAVQRLVFTNCDDLPVVMNERRGFICVRGTDLDRLTTSDLQVIDTWLRGEVAAPALKGPLPYQREALDNIAQGLKAGDRATVVMACGSGKTLVALWAAQELGVKRIIVLLPSLALVRQSLHEWLNQTSWPRLRFIAVCSDPTVAASNEDNLRVEQADLDFAITTQAAEVRAFLGAAFDGVRVVFSTYQSARVVSEAIGPAGEGFDLGIFDEAHKTTGREDKSFGLALADRNIPIAKRLFLTATPRHYDVRTRDKEGEHKLVYSMDDTATYGPIVHTLSFAAAARRGIVCHCKILISVVVSAMVDNDVLQRGEVLVNGDAIRADTVANQIALQKACEAYDLKKVFSFHTSVAAARDFTGDSSSSVRQHLPAYEALHVNGAMPTAHREKIMRAFRQAERAVISNARCLTEGVDVPVVDVVAFLSPKKSKVDIVQAAGRAIRTAPNKTVGYVLLPLFVETATGETIEEALARTGFQEVWNVIGALAEQDEVLADIIRQMRVERGRRGGFDDSRLREIVEVIGPSVLLETLRAAVSAQIVESIGSTWDERFGELSAYKDRYGDCGVPQGWAENPSLGAWVSTQRKAYIVARPTLSADRIARLNALGFEWHLLAAAWEKSFAALAAYKDQYGDCRVPRGWAENPSLGGWIHQQRNAYSAAQPTISVDRIARLNALGFDWDPLAAAWEENFAALAAYKDQYGDCGVPQRWSDNPSLGQWVSSQRQAYNAAPPTISPDRIARLNALGFDWDTLAAAWEENFAALVAYKDQYGDFRVPRGWSDNSSLGGWVSTQRSAYSAAPPTLSVDRIARLNALGFEWDPLAAAWEENFAALAVYKDQYGDCRVPQRWVENPALGKWVHNQRSAYRAAPPTISADRIARLEVLGFEWDPLTAAWEKNFAALAAYKDQYGDCRVTGGWAENPSLGVWVSTQLSAYSAAPPTISADRIARLNALGFDWDRLAAVWEENFAALAVYKDQYGDCRVPQRWAENPSLGSWVSTQRQAYSAAPPMISADRIARLNALGFEWDLLAAAWEENFAALAVYKDQYGDCGVSNRWPENPSLGNWVSTQRKAYNAAPPTISTDRIARLNALGFDWSVRAAPFAVAWEENFAALAVYKDKYGDCRVPQGWSENPSLGSWVSNQRSAYRAAPLTISADRIARLNSLGFDWDTLAAVWEENFAALAVYKDQYGDCRVPAVWPENPSLGNWVSKQRSAYSAAPPTISADRIALLNALGFDWDLLAAAWEENFAALAAYKDQFGDCRVAQRWVENPALGKWVGTQRRAYSAAPPTISADRIARLEALGFEWDLLAAAWEENFAALAAYKDQYGDCRVPQKWSENPSLGSWVSNQRSAYKAAPPKISADRIARLNALGFDWGVRAEP